METMKVTADNERAQALALEFGSTMQAFFGRGKSGPQPQEIGDALQAVAIFAAAILRGNPMAINTFLDEVRQMATEN